MKFKSGEEMYETMYESIFSGGVVLYSPKLEIFVYACGKEDGLCICSLTMQQAEMLQQGVMKNHVEYSGIDVVRFCEENYQYEWFDSRVFSRVHEIRRIMNPKEELFKEQEQFIRDMADRSYLEYVNDDGSDDPDEEIQKNDSDSDLVILLPQSVINKIPKEKRKRMEEILKANFDEYNWNQDDSGTII